MCAVDLGGGEGKANPGGKLELFHFWTRSERPPANAFVSTFEEKYGIDVSKNILDWSTYTIITESRMAKGEPPDIFMGDIGQRLGEFVRAGELADLNELWEDEGFFEVFPEWLVEACTFDGGPYGVPSKYFTFPVWYLKDTFEQYGVSPPETWEEFLELCETFREADLAPIVASDWGTSLWFRNILPRKTGPEFYKKLMKGEESWTDERVIETYEILRHIVRDYFYEYPFRQTFPSAWDKLNDRKAAMLLQGDWVNGMWMREHDYAPEEEYDYFLLPPLDSKIGQVMVVGGNVWMLSEQAPHPEEALKFLKYAGSLDSQRLLAEERLGILAHKEVPRDVYDPISARLRDEIAEYPTVLEMGVALPPQVASVEELQRIQILLSSSIEEGEIRDQVAEIESAARRVHATKRD